MRRWFGDGDLAARPAAPPSTSSIHGNTPLAAHAESRPAPTSRPPQHSGALARITSGLGHVPEPTLRWLLDAFRLRMRYDRKTGLMEYEVTITSETVETQHDATVCGDQGRWCGPERRSAWYSLRGWPPTGSARLRRPPDDPVRILIP
jgi:hypothetical protein